MIHNIITEPAKTQQRNLFLKQHLQEAFNRDGYVVIDFLTPAEVKALEAEYNRLPEAMGQPAFASTIMSPDSNYRRSISAIVTSAFERAIHKTFDDANLFFGNFNLKYPGSAGTVQMHQDISFFDEEQFSSMVVWVPLTDTTTQNGAIQVIPGSHNVLTQPRCGGRPFPYSHIESELLERFGKQLLMKAGQAYIASPMLFHYSSPNMGTAPRIAAAGIMGPMESSLRYYQYAQIEGVPCAEVFEVDQDYYVSELLFSKPDQNRYKLIETIPLETKILPQEAVFAALAELQ